MRLQKSNKWLIVGLLSFVLAIGLIILAPVSLQKVAQAVTGNYNRAVSENSLSRDDWNKLDDDFLLKDGGTMAGDINMNNHKVTNLSTPTANTDAATKQYVDSNSGSGAIFTNWGRGDCPSGTNLLYGGYTFSLNPEGYPGGGANPLCIKAPLVGTEVPTNQTLTGHLYSVGTSQARSLPTDIPELKEMKCAVCHKATGSCYENFGDSACGSGFSPIYTGWVLGGLTNINRKNEFNFLCVNETFDGTTANNNISSTIYGATIQGDADITAYSKQVFLRCSICCN